MSRNITLSDAARKLRMSKLTPADRKINSELSELKMKRSPYVVMYFRRGRLVVENYITRRSFQIDLDGLCSFDISRLGELLLRPPKLWAGTPESRSFIRFRTLKPLAC